MNRYPNILKSVGLYVINKWVSIAVMFVGFILYNVITAVAVATDTPAPPFTEVFYAGLSILTVIVAAPLVRLMVFNEAAMYAESGQLDEDMKGKSYPPALLHYWFATAVCYFVCVACMATITK